MSEVEGEIREGITTKQLDQWVYRYITGHGGRPAFLGYGGFPGSACISVNDEVIHGIPGNRVLHNGDIVSMDLGINLNIGNRISGMFCGPFGSWNGGQVHQMSGFQNLYLEMQ